METFNTNNNEETPIDWDNLEFEEIQTEYEDVIKWDPNPNESLVGVYVESTHGTGQGTGLVFHKLEDRNGNVYSVLGSTVIDNALDKIAYGTVVKITFTGYATSKNGRDYKTYTIATGK